MIVVMDGIWGLCGYRNFVTADWTFFSNTAQRLTPHYYFFFKHCVQEDQFENITVAKLYFSNTGSTTSGIPDYNHNRQ